MEKEKDEKILYNTNIDPCAHGKIGRFFFFFLFLICFHILLSLKKTMEEIVQRDFESNILNTIQWLQMQQEKQRQVVEEKIQTLKLLLVTETMEKKRLHFRYPDILPSFPDVRAWLDKALIRLNHGKIFTFCIL